MTKNELIEQMAAGAGITKAVAKAALDTALNAITNCLAEDGKVQMCIRDRFDIDHSLLQMEITETAMLRSPEYSIHIMREFRKRGIRFSMDDFGTGYSNFIGIATLPVSEVKLDKSFLDTMRQMCIRDRTIAKPECSCKVEIHGSNCPLSKCTCSQNEHTKDCPLYGLSLIHILRLVSRNTSMVGLMAVSVSLTLL